MKFRNKLSLAIALATTATFATANDELEALKKTVAEQQKQLDALSEQVDATNDAVENSSAASKVSIGGYGELHYNNYLDNEKAGKDDQVDFHRFVLFFNYEFNERWNFFSELEVEHAYSGGSKPGYVELEQAYVEYMFDENHYAKGGLFLVPVGILNETHEPPTFFGTERNPVEKYIVPTTWWEAGAAGRGQYANGISWDFAAHSGLESTDGYSIRGGRQKVAKATANKGALTGRVRYNGVPGLELAATAQYQQDLYQAAGPDTASATLLQAHAVYEVAGFGIRAFYATWNVDGEAAKTAGADEQTGYYIEPSYTWNDTVGVFVRYNNWDNAAGNSVESAIEQVDFGVNYWPIEQIVLKADISQYEEKADGGKDYDIFNLGIGYNF